MLDIGHCHRGTVKNIGLTLPYSCYWPLACLWNIKGYARIQRGGVGCGPPPSTEKSQVKVSIETVIHLQFWAYGSWDSLFPISMNPTANF